MINIRSLSNFNQNYIDYLTLVLDGCTDNELTPHDDLLLLFSKLIDVQKVLDASLNESKL